MSSKERKERLQSSAANATTTTTKTTKSISKSENESSEHFIPKRYVPKKLLRKRSTDRRRRRNFIDDALACILEDPAKEGTLSPVSEEKDKTTSYSCPALINSQHSRSTATTTDTAGTEESERSLSTVDCDDKDLLILKRPMSCEDPSQWVSIEKEMNSSSNNNNLNDSISRTYWNGVGKRNLLVVD